MRNILRPKNKKLLIKEVKEPVKQRFLELKEKSHSTKLTLEEKLWIAHAFELEQFIKTIYEENNPKDFVVISAPKLIDLAERLMSGETLKGSY
jgi:hypothetical protein